MKVFQATIRVSEYGRTEVSTQEVTLLAETYAQAEEKIIATYNTETYKDVFIFNLNVFADASADHNYNKLLGY